MRIGNETRLRENFIVEHFVGREIATALNYIIKKKKTIYEIWEEKKIVTKALE